LTYELTQEQQILRETIRDFAQSEILPLAAKIDWERRIPNELLGKLPRLGLFGITVPSEFGGVGADLLSFVVAIEEVSKASGSLGASLSFHNAVVCEALASSTNTTLRQSLLPKLAEGRFGAFDFASIHEENKMNHIVCKVEGSELVVNGRSEYVVNADLAEVFLVLGNLDRDRAQNDPLENVLFAFSKHQVASRQFVVGEPKKLLGMRATGTARISFNNLRLPLQSLVYEIHKTKEAINSLVARSNLAVAAQALGVSQASIDASVKYAGERSQFNTKIGNFYAVQEMIASDMIDLETSRAQTYMSAQRINDSPIYLRDSAIAKVSASNGAVRASRHAIRIHGGYGFTRDYPVERFARDARLTQIYSVSNEDLKALIARSLLG
jgi:alkylation response protein AidB-like acyl-CoA dehydrogenase